MRDICRGSGRLWLAASLAAVATWGPRAGHGTPLANPFPRSFTDDPFVDDEKFIEIASRHEILSIEGEKAVIPCDVTSDHLSDRPRLILWYRGTNKVPIYSFDLRASQSGQHWRDNNTLGSRGYVYYEESSAQESILPGGRGGQPEDAEVRWSSALHVEPVYRGDAGKYRCRVDFTISPTFNSWVKLKVIVPPKAPVIENERGQVLSTGGGGAGASVVAETDPVAEGGSLRLHCLTAGDPVPTVSWRYGGIPLQPVSLHSDANSGQVRSTVTLDDIRRRQSAALGSGSNDHAGGGGGSPNGQQQLVECSAQNNDLTPPATVAVRLRVISPPLRVKIVRERAMFAVGESYNLTCQVLGSSPAPQVSFLIGGRGGGGHHRLLPLTWSQESPDGSVFSAVARYDPLAGDSGEFLACRANNRLLPDTRLEDQWKLDVHYGPDVKISWLDQREGDSVREGEKLELKCEVAANPPHHTILWYREGLDIESYQEENIQILGEHLLVAGIRREQAGSYHCAATNDIRTAVAKPLPIVVRFAPACSLKDRDRTLSVSPHDSLDLRCKMDSSERTDFLWTFIAAGGGGVAEELPRSEYRRSGQDSVLSYVVRTDADYGRIECRGVNSLGTSTEPCTFTIQREGVSMSWIKSCTSYNQTFTSFTIECFLVDRTATATAVATAVANNNNNMFLFEVFDAHSMETVSNITSSSPRVTLTGLPSSADFIIHVLAVGGGGAGGQQPYIIEAFTLRTGEKQVAASIGLESRNPIGFLPILGVLAGIFIVLVILTLAVVVAVRRRLGGLARMMVRRESDTKTTAHSRQPAKDWAAAPNSPDIIPRFNAADLDCNSMEDLSRNNGEERPMPVVNSFMPLYSSDDSQANSIEYAELSLTDTQSLMPLAANAAIVVTAGGGQTLSDRRVGGDLSPIIYSQIVHHIPPRTFASDYSLGGRPMNPLGGGGREDDDDGGTASSAALPSSSTTMTTVTSGSGGGLHGYSAEAEINHPGSSLSLDVAPSEYLERSLVSSFRVPCKRVKFRDEVSTRGYDTFPFRKDVEYLCALHQQSHLAAVSESNNTCGAPGGESSAAAAAVTCKATQDVESRL